MNRNTAVGIGGVVVIVALVAGTTLFFNRSAIAPDSKQQDSLSGGSEKAPRTSEKPNQGAVMELQKTDIEVGTGAEAVAGKNVTVNYVGTLTDGTKFDSSYDRNEPFSFPLGAGRVIKGWDQGVEGMKVGGKRKLVIPSELGYGSRGAGASIPPDSTLVFEIELLGVE